MWRRRRERRAEQAARTQAAKAGVEQARTEKARSLDRQQRVRDQVIGPMWQAGEHNQFASMIRQTLIGNGGEQV
jgi:hypothetical protein